MRGDRPNGVTHRKRPLPNAPLRGINRHPKRYAPIASRTWDDDDKFGPEGSGATGVSGQSGATSEAAFPLDEAAWKQMVAVLTAMKPILVKPSEERTGQMGQAEPVA